MVETKSELKVMLLILILPIIAAILEKYMGININYNAIISAMGIGSSYPLLRTYKKVKEASNGNNNTNPEGKQPGHIEN